jgi:hypothetical protein
MKLLLRIFSWKTTLLLSIIILLTLIVFSFYGLYTNKFYLFKFDNYIFPILTLVHFVYIYVVWFKINENEVADPQMRKLEFAMYVILLIYIFRFFDTLFVLLSYGDFESHVIPKTFIPIGTLIMFFYALLMVLTLITIKYRKKLIGSYRFDEINEQQIDSWE